MTRFRVTFVVEIDEDFADLDLAREATVEAARAFVRSPSVETARIASIALDEIGEGDYDRDFDEDEG